MKPEEQEQLLELANGVLENSLSPAERERLEEWIERDGEARRILTDFLHDHAVLYWEHVGNGESAKVVDFPGVSANPRQSFFWPVAAACAALLAVAAFLFNPSEESGADTFAILKKTQAAQWGGGDLPTAQGARLGAGRLDLVSGLATLAFDSGAEVVLEAPVRVELIDEMNCVLVNGTAVAEVPESAHGFRIDTAAARVIDHGTRFAVRVDESSGTTRTQVFDGLVEVALPDSKKTVTLLSGQQNVAVPGELGEVEQGTLEGEWSSLDRKGRREGRWRRLTTGFGGGTDGYVYATEIKNHQSDELLLLKNSTDERGPHRKAYLRFDLSQLRKQGKIAEAALELHFSPTGWGLATNTPDAIFEIYGLIDDSLDDWTYGDMTWESAPANETATGDTLMADKVVPLGSFTVPQGVQSGLFGIETPALADFLAQDRNNLATLVIVRKTLETEGGGLVHGIASRRHPVLPPPTLVVRQD